MDYLGSCFVELAAIVKDELDVAPELVFAAVGVSSHLVHHCRDVHRPRNDRAVLFIHRVITKCFRSDRMQEVRRFVMVIQLTEYEPAFLHLTVSEFLFGKWIID